MRPLAERQHGIWLDAGIQGVYWTVGFSASATGAARLFGLAGPRACSTTAVIAGPLKLGRSTAKSYPDSCSRP